MRNLKKFLALVLAMMMIFSLMVSVNAADYTDINKVNSTYKEAVDVTDALDIFRGRDGNTFQPQSNMRRDEFATVLYRLATGDVHDEHLDEWRGIVSFADIPADNWAAPYVAYAYSAKLMQGDGTNFHPTLPINGYDCALALLRLLGYGKKDEYTGSYQLNVAIDGARIGLTSVVGTRNLNGFATREIIAELAYDALSCDMVYYDHDRDSYYQNDSRSDSAKLGAVIFDMEVIRQGQPKNPNNPQGATWNLMPDFKLTRDVFCRPDPEYVVLSKGDVIYEGRPSAVATYNGNFTGADAQPYLTAYTAATATVTLYYNGVQVVNPMSTSASLPTFTKSDAITGNLGLWIDDDTGIPGYEIEIYDVTPDKATKVQYRVIVREAALAEVGETNESTGNIDLNPQTYAPTPAASITGATVRSATGGSPLVIPKTANVYAALAAHEEDDLVAVYFKGGNAGQASDVLEVAEMQGIETTINHIDRNTWKYTDNKGNVYQRAKDTYFPAGGGNYSDNYGTTGDTYLYLLNGYILYREPINAVATTGYAYLADVREDNQGWEIEDGGKIYTARLYLSDNTSVDVRAKDFESSANNPAGDTHVLRDFGSQDPKQGELVWYSVGPDGIYTIREINSYKVPTATDLVVKKGQADGTVYTAAGTTAVVYDSKTVFFVVNRNASTGAVISVVPHTGIANVPTTIASAGSTMVAAAKAYDPANGNTTGDNATAGSRVTAVMIVNPVSSIVSNYFIVGNPHAEKITEGTGSKRVEYYVYNAVVGGKITTVKVGAGTNQPANGGTLTGVNYYSAVIESGGMITRWASAALTGNGVRGVWELKNDGTNTITRTSNTVINIEGKGNYVTDNLKAYFYNPATGVIRSADLSKIDGDCIGFMVIDSSSGIDVLTELYLLNTNI